MENTGSGLVNRPLHTFLDSVPLRLLHGDAGVSVTGVTADSRRVQPGTIFVAVRGHARDGHAYLGAAVAAGASALVVQDPASLPAPLPDSHPTVLVAEDSRRALAALARTGHDFPDRALRLIAVTGTNGKTTVAHCVRDLLRARGESCGLLGTIEYDTGRRRMAAPLTTPAAEDLFAWLAEARDHGCSTVVMEASSHALDQERLGEAEVDVAAFTNLGRDHLDYHRDAEDYLRAKRRLLERLGPQTRSKGPGRAVVHLDVPAFAALTWPAGTISVGRAADRDLRLRRTRFGAEETELEIEVGARVLRLRTALVGSYNAENLLVALGVIRALGVDPEEFAALVGAVRPVPGRLERVALEGGPTVIVDYAHTAEGLAEALRAVRPLTPGRVHLVFGCGGDRDRGKRPEMARVAQEYADAIYLTSDNPRHEDPQQIYADIESGFSPSGAPVRRIEDRAEAVAEALSTAAPEDLVLVTGKGHENYQIVGAERRPWDDRLVIREAWSTRRGT